MSGGILDRFAIEVVDSMLHVLVIGILMISRLLSPLWGPKSYFIELG